MQIDVWNKLTASWDQAEKQKERQEESASVFFETIAQNDWLATARLIEQGCSPNLALGMRTPLMCAAENGSLESLQLLLRSGASIGAQDETGRDAIFCAVESFQDAALAIMLKRMPKLKRISEDNRTPLITAAQNSNLPAVRLLVAYDKNSVHQYDRFGRTALWHVLSKPELSDDDNEIAKILLDSGADPTIPDINGISAQNAAASQSAQALLERNELAQTIDAPEPEPDLQEAPTPSTPKRTMRL